ncbi:hypothetical protein HELRODRAFT_184251 [Helobdella robusta]|uniref:Uncharacterized protein n=1 Tax=Helobdella robusta TaxID=6412 RepID=T1FKU9_HELRO|nr:hypothetical protein HELRODRAFT_184251 [Helobdella robusta]ESO04146.1 hypothetical protein HELRODRAFT_184251 [Helobdella robusta]
METNIVVFIYRNLEPTDKQTLDYRWKLQHGVGDKEIIEAITSVLVVTRSRRSYNTCVRSGIFKVTTLVSEMFADMKADTDRRAEKQFVAIMAYTDRLAEKQFAELKAYEDRLAEKQSADVDR